MGSSTKYMIEGMSDENTPKEILDAAREYNSLNDEIEKLKMQHFALDKFSAKRRELGFKIDKLMRKKGIAKSKIHGQTNKTDIEKLNSSFRGVALKCLPTRIYLHILSSAEIQADTPSYEPPILNILSDKDSETIENAKKLKVENEMLRAKIYNARKMILELTPNLLGNLDTKEYDRRVFIQKLLSKINREL